MDPKAKSRILSSIGLLLLLCCWGSPLANPVILTTPVRFPGLEAFFPSFKTSDTAIVHLGFMNSEVVEVVTTKSGADIHGEFSFSQVNSDTSERWVEILLPIPYFGLIPPDTILKDASPSLIFDGKPVTSIPKARSIDVLENSMQVAMISWIFKTKIQGPFSFEIRYFQPFVWPDLRPTIPYIPLLSQTTDLRSRDAEYDGFKLIFRNLTDSHFWLAGTPVVIHGMSTIQTRIERGQIIFFGKKKD